MLLKIAQREERVIKYENDGQFELLTRDAIEQHKSMLRNQLLDFSMEWAEYKIADLLNGHDGWITQSKDIFRALFLLERDPPADALCEEHATQLVFTIKIALLSTLAFVRAEHIPAMTTAYDALSLREAACTAIDWYFDVEAHGGLQMLEIEYEDDANAAHN